MHARWMVPGILLIAMTLTALPRSRAQTSDTTQNTTQGQISPEQKQNIQSIGYNAGFRDGTMDARNNQPYDFKTHTTWQNATTGYQSSSGTDQVTYQYNFRAGYERGYADGFYGRTPEAATAPSAAASPQSSQAPPATTTQPGFPAPGAQTSTTPSSQGQATGELPVGTQIHLQLQNTLSTRSSSPGDSFTATVSQPVLGPNQAVMIPQGSVVMGTVAQVTHAGTVTGQSQLQLQFNRLRLPDGHEIALNASLSGVQQGGGIGSVITGSPSTSAEGGVQQSKTRSTIGGAVAGTAAGSILGAILGGGKGAGIGAAIGAGLGIVLASRTGNVDLPAGTPMTITLDRPVQLQ